MSNVVIKVEDLGKLYKLGEISTGTISHDLNRWWARMRGKEDPFAKIGEINDRTAKGNSGYVWALKDINFEVKQGEVLGIIGRNGAGKSTLLKILSKVTTQTTGQIKIKGRIASLLEVGTGFHPELTGRENIFLNGAILGMNKAEIRHKFDEIVDFSGVERYIDTPVKRYSSGMYVRLAFAVAAFLEPEILIVDEVLAVGDAEFQKKCLGRMREVSSYDGRTVLFVSHNMSSINSLCKNAILLNKGTIEEYDVTSNVINSYLNNRFNFDSLRERSERKGNQSLRLIGILFREVQSQKVISKVTSGDSVMIDLTIEKKEDIGIKDLEIGLGISDAYDNRITLISNKLSGQEISLRQDTKDKIFSVQILINKLSLACGQYSVTSFIASNGIINDWVQDAFQFPIETDNFFPDTIQTLPPNQGVFYLDYKFI